MHPTTDEIIAYLYRQGIGPNTTYVIYEGPDGLSHAVGWDVYPREGYTEIARFTTDRDPPQSPFDIRFLLENGWF